MHAEKRKTWDLAKTWKKFRPPIRPSAGTLKIFDRWITKKEKENKEKPALCILGSTPEFRDRATAHGIVPWVVDYSSETYAALGTLREKKGKEIFRRQDWRKLALPKKFDLIFAEASLTVLPKRDVPIVLQRIVRHCKYDGYFLTKIWIRLSNERKSIAAMANHYRRHPHGKDFYTSVAPLLYCALYDQRLETLSLRDMFLICKQAHEKGILRDEELESIERLGYAASSLHLYIPMKEDIERLFRRFFIIEAVIYGESPYGAYTPTYILRKL